MGLMLACEGIDDSLVSALKFFKKGVHDDGSLIDYKSGVVIFLADLYSSMDKVFGEEKGFNSTLEERQNLYINAARSAKMAKEKISKLQPKNAKLLGGRASELCKAVKNESELYGGYNNSLCQYVAKQTSRARGRGGHSGG